MTQIKRFIVSEHEALTISRRVLRLVRGYIRRQKSDLLVTDGNGLMTWGEINNHVSSTLALRLKSRSSKKQKETKG